MAIDTGAFIAGVGVLVGFDILSITLTFALARAVGEDEQARGTAGKALALARDAEGQAQAAHERVTKHRRDSHGEDVQTAAEAEREARHAD